VSRVLLISKPLEAPWNDSSKNLVRDLVFGLERFDATGLGRKGGETRLGRADIDPIHPAGRGSFAPAMLEQGRVLARLLADRGSDLFHYFFAPNPKTSGVARGVSRLRRKPTVQTVCSVPKADVSLDRVLFGDRVVVLSEHTEQRFLAAGIARERVVRIPPAAPPLTPLDADARRAARRELGLPSDAPLVLYPGDLEFGNGARFVLEAHAALPKDTALVLACRTKTPRALEIAQGLKQRAEALGTAARVTFLGETPDILKLVGCADVVALPSDVAYAKMDYPLVLLEAMALARPIVVCEGTPAAELARHEGAIATGASAAAVAEVLDGLLADSTRREALGAGARRAALADYGRSGMARAYETLYAALL
jgi:glycosyltransferase involved in cell wall biosynthesis